MGKDIIETIKKDINNFLKNNYSNLEISKISSIIGIPSDLEMGDYFSNLPFILKGIVKKPVHIIGKEIVEWLKETGNYLKVVFKSPGYVNLTLKNETIIQQSKFDLRRDIKPLNKTYYMEYVSANPTGVLHLGHLRIGFASQIYGSLVELLGGKVYKEFLVNDGGVQIETFMSSAKALINSSFQNRNVVYYSDELENYCLTVKESKNINKEGIVGYFVNEIKKDMKLLGIDLEGMNFISENTFASEKKTKRFYDNLIKKGICYIKDDAVFIKTTNVGDSDDRVVIKSNGNRTYVGTDILYHTHKFKNNYDLYINVWGSDQQGNGATLKKAMELLKYEKRDRFWIVYSQLIQIKKGGKIQRMSKRLGTNITVRKLAEIIDIRLIIHYIMSKSLSTTLAIDLEELIRKRKTNPMYYLQYTYARIFQLIKKSEKWLGVNKHKNSSKKKKITFSPRERRLVQMAVNSKKVLLEVEKSFELNKIYSYLYELCELFHSYYQNEKILSENNSYESIIAKLNIVKLVQRIISDFFGILNIERKEKME